LLLVLCAPALPAAAAAAKPAALIARPAPAGPAGEAVDLGMMTRIRDEGLHRSQVMDILTQLTERIGPRLTGSPQLKAANDWAMATMASWGMVNTHLEGFPFGRGWSYSHVAVHMTKPHAEPLFAIPKAWTPGTQGPLRGAAVLAVIESEKDLDQYKGKLAGKVVFVSKAVDFSVKPPNPPAPERLSDSDLDKLAQFEVPPERDVAARTRMGLERYKLRRAINEFLVSEKAVAFVDASNRRNGILQLGAGGSFETGKPEALPGLTMAAEAYNHVLRLLDMGETVELEIEVAAAYNDAPQAFNTVGEIPGTDKAGELVMAGGHMDSWHPATGATDDGCGVAVVLEAMRILKALGVKPRRTIRAILWAGEEQGLLGSRNYVKEHFASRPDNTDPEVKDLPDFLKPQTWPITVKPEHAKVAAYFNLDNGSGKIRGVHTEENAAVGPIFAAWLEPFHDLGADSITERPTGGTDHVSYNAVGLPGFQFIQDELFYEELTHHTQLDTIDHARREDLMQASTIMAAFLYDAAMRDQMLPRKPVPQKPPEPKKKKSDKPDDKKPG
jgi:hypothetical protein